MNNKGVFITATDTGVGKTIVSAAIIRGLIKRGVKAGAMKPVETGCSKEKVNGQGSMGMGLIPADGMFLKETAGMDDFIDLITPVRFEHPLAPMVASDLEKTPVVLNKIFSAYEALSKKYEFMVVEGAGGILVPVARKGQRGYFISDLIKDLNLPVIIVARPCLGTLNHTLLTVNYAIGEGIKVLGIVINHSSHFENSVAEKTNPAVLKEICPAPVIWEVPFVDGIRIKDIEMPDSLYDAIYRCGHD